MYIDSHAHLFNEDFGKDLHETITRARDAGVECIIVPGTNEKTSSEAIELSERYDIIYACVGVHPHDALHASDRSIEQIDAMSAHKKVVAIGEIGLDFHYDFSPQDKQTQVFKSQIDLAIRKNLPIVVHTRESLMETMAIVNAALEEHPAWCPARRTSPHKSPMARGVFHCFTGSAEDAEVLFARGFFVSYPGIATFKNSPVIDVIHRIGYENILLETDSPYMAPVPLRGTRNEPANIIHIGKHIANMLKVSEREVAGVTTLNARFLFGLDNVS